MHCVKTVDEIPPGRESSRSPAARSASSTSAASFFALRNRCPHQGGPLCEGRSSGFPPPAPGRVRVQPKGEILRCPWHGWEFDVRTGQSWFDPRRTRVKAYPVEVEELQAETYPVEIERERVVVIVT